MINTLVVEHHVNKPIIFMYSGQGSHYFQMGKELFLTNHLFKKSCLAVEEIYHDLTSTSLIDYLYHEKHAKSDLFTETYYSHPAIFMIEYAMTQALLAQGVQPAAVLGASMGEFAAATTAGILNLESALTAVIKQAESLENHAERGGMLAILSHSELYQEKFYLSQLSELAAVNFPGHFVVAGKTNALEEIKAKLSEENIVSQLLPVSFAFHSSLIDTAKADFLTSISTLSTHPARIPFISCTEAQSISPTQTHWWDIIRKPILFQQAIQQLEDNQAMIYVDVGPSGTLATFVKYCLPATSASSSMTVLSPYGQVDKNLNQLLVTLGNAIV
jgi:acyl transferase domain-containing protein